MSELPASKQKRVSRAIGSRLAADDDDDSDAGPTRPPRTANTGSRVRRGGRERERGSTLADPAMTGGDLESAAGAGDESMSRISMASRAENFGPSALFLCLVLENPFDPEEDSQRPVDSSLFEGYEVFEDIYVDNKADATAAAANAQKIQQQLATASPTAGGGGGEGDALMGYRAHQNNGSFSGVSSPTAAAPTAADGAVASLLVSGAAADAIGAQLLPDNMRTGLKDEDLLREPTSLGGFGPLGEVHVVSDIAQKKKKAYSKKGEADHDAADQQQHKISDDFAPNKFQKVIEIILRLEKRELDVFPEDMIVEADFSECGNANYFKGWKLDRSRLLTSPTQDTLYIKVHARRSVLCRFAEKASIPLLTHDFSFGGGAAMPYTEKLEAELTRSVKKYFRTFEPENAHMGLGTVRGFDIQPPHKLRLLVRYLREQWRFGGCGLQLNEMKRRSILVKDYFPLHNKAFIEKHELEGWASLNVIRVHKGLFADKTEALTIYFGEQVGLYFQWLREYVIVLIALGVAGLFMGASTRIWGNTALTNASFAIACVTWAFYWNLHWNRKESMFCIDNCQEEQLEQAPVRDEFRVTAMQPIECADLYRMRFKYPLSLRVTADGSFLNLYYSNAKRLMIRYMFSYPIVLLLTAGMVTVLTLINYWRFENPDDELISYATSVLSVMAGQVFGVLFELIVGLLNWCENNRTDADEDNERIYKSFFFYFFSFYFSLFSICLWPIEGPSYVRLQQLQAQMLIICIVKPVIATASGLAVPWLLCSMRRRYGITGGVCGTLASLICCKSLRALMEEKGIDPEDEGTQMWMEAQLQPFDSTAKDYLRVTLQFGYMSMFAATFPFAAPAALLYNIIDRRADAARILHYCQRPMAKPSANIGPWKRIFIVISVCAVVTNCYLICVLSPIYDKIGLGEQAKESEGFKWMGYIVVQYGLLGIGFLLATVIPPIPVASHKLLLKRFLLTNPSIRQRFYDRNKAEALAAIQEVAADPRGEGGAAAEDAPPQSTASLVRRVRIASPPPQSDL